MTHHQAFLPILQPIQMSLVDVIAAAGHAGCVMEKLETTKDYTEFLLLKLPDGCKHFLGRHRARCCSLVQQLDKGAGVSTCRFVEHLTADRKISRKRHVRVAHQWLQGSLLHVLGSL